MAPESRSALFVKCRIDHSRTKPRNAGKEQDDSVQECLKECVAPGSESCPRTAAETQRSQSPDFDKWFCAEDRGGRIILES